MSAVLSLLRNSLFPDKAVIEKDLQQNLSENLNLSLTDPKKKSGEAFRIKEIRMPISKNNWNNFFLLDIQKKHLKM